MYNVGDLSCSSDLIDPKSGHLTQIFHKVRHMLPLSKSPIPSEDEFIISTLLEENYKYPQEKSMEVVKVLCEHHWTSSCIVSMSKFQVICGGPKEASVILSHLSECGKAKYLAVKRKELIEGVKISLSLQTVSGTTSPDYDVLHLTWTAEKLQLQLDMIDQCRDKSKMLVVPSLKSWNKISALRQAREMKLASESREKWSVSSYAEFDEDIEDELDKLKLEESGKSVADGGIREQESLSKSLSNLKLADNNVVTKTPNNVSKVVDDPPLVQLVREYEQQLADDEAQQLWSFQIEIGSALSTKQSDLVLLASDEASNSPVL
ncbi:hypothetical protein L6452_41980 [Arctium lappa]|uniref:Uncharacterized protein n=1 Tax=Arctium lappa TaxID=4217 RepID=A0ACB8XHH1_ARCLA|nr:hypothetical protein L6452_41980 [Arctium lappa]